MLLSLPDPPDLVGRGHHQTYAGSAARREQIKRDLGTAFVQWSRQMWTDGDISRVVSVRRMRVVRRA